jgi:ribosomal protein S18 acetylase RimI-like enzyme
MFRIKNMSPEDFPFAVNITDEMNWGMTDADFQFNLNLEPQGCFVLLDNSEKVGLATCISFGDVGWFGNLIVKKTHRNSGGGSLLVEHAIQHLRNRKVETVGLYAYIDKVPMYERLGFKRDTEFTYMKGKGFHTTSKEKMRKCGKHDFTAIIQQDSHCFGGARRRLLEPILSDPDNLCYVGIENGKLCGFITVVAYDKTAELGPLVCQRERGDIAVALAKTVLDKLDGFEVSLCLPKQEASIVNVLAEAGFKETFPVARMFLGPPPRGECIYVAESLERG